MIVGMYRTDMMHDSAVFFPGGSGCHAEVYHIILVLLGGGRNVYN